MCETSGCGRCCSRDGSSIPASHALGFLILPAHLQAGICHEAACRGVEAVTATLLLGSIGLGLVWGWLAGMWGIQARRRIRYVLAVAATTAVLGLEVLWIAGGWPLALFLVASGSGWVAHAYWRRTLRRRFRAGADAK